MPDRFPLRQIPCLRRPVLSRPKTQTGGVIKALGADPAALMRGADLNWHIDGEHGDIRPLPQGFEVFLACASPAEWKDAKARLGFFVVKENGVSGIMSAAGAARSRSSGGHFGFAWDQCRRGAVMRLRRRRGLSAIPLLPGWRDDSAEATMRKTLSSA